MNKPIIETTVLEGTSLYRDSTYRQYLGDINISSYKKELEEKKQLVYELPAFSSDYTKIFMGDSDTVYAVNRIEGIQFIGGAKPVPGTDYFKPESVGQRHSGNYPLYNFITTPPDGAKMWTISQFFKGNINMIWMVISTKYKNDNSYRLHRAPLPNLSFPDGHLCMGNAFKDSEKSFDPNTIQKNIHKIMLSGWNNDWHRNEVYFVEKDQFTMKIRWHKPIIQIGECVLNEKETFKSMINRLENEENKYQKIKTIFLADNEVDYKRIERSREDQTTSGEATEGDNTEGNTDGQTEPTTLQNTTEENTDVQNRDIQTQTENQVIPGTNTPIPEPVTAPPVIDLR